MVRGVFRYPFMPSMPSLLVCPLCDHSHEFPELASGESALCERCGTTLARGTPRIGADAALAFTVTGLLLAAPALWLPFVEVSKFQALRHSTAFDGVRALWEADMRLLAIWVFLCGLAVPLLLLGTLAGVLLPLRFGWQPKSLEQLRRSARAFERWCMPEVYLLAVLVAFAKLGSLVNVRIGLGLWCYGAMAVCIVVAWRNFELYHAPRVADPGRPAAATGATSS